MAPNNFLFLHIMQKYMLTLIVNPLLLARGCVNISEEKNMLGFSIFPHCRAFLLLKLGNQIICFFYQTVKHLPS